VQWLHETARPGVETQKAYDNLVTQIVAKNATSVRGLNLHEKKDPETKLLKLEAADRARGVTLRTLLLTRMPEEDPPP
jgi:hypothetical protein